MWKKILLALTFAILAILAYNSFSPFQQRNQTNITPPCKSPKSVLNSNPPPLTVNSEKKERLLDNRNPFAKTPPNGPQIVIEGEDTCFCQLQGSIDDCTCNIDTVDKFNNYKIFPRLKSLLHKDYFRFFQINLQKQCPYWNDEAGQCALEGCQVRECREDEVPSGLKGNPANGLTNNQRRQRKSAEVENVEEIVPCSEDLGYLNTSISEQIQEGFERWKAYDDKQIDFCSIRDDEIDPDLQYVDLLLNPERYTGYAGPSAHRIWSTIYNENCFKENTDVLAPFTESTNELCIEKRTFYRAISGLHSSINIHLSAKYLLAGQSTAFLGQKDEKLWGPNITEFRSHFDSDLTNGQSPAWLKNLYFLYLLELKAVWKLGPFLRTFDPYTGNNEDDTDVRHAIRDLLNVIDTFPSHFEEKALFSTKDAMKLKSDFHKRFTNITMIMDCVGCQKCKLWGKLQIKGLGTALRILFTDPGKLKESSFSRNEIVSLINGFGKLSESIYELDNLRQLTKVGGQATNG